MVIFSCYTVTVHDVDNSNMGKSAMKSRGNVRELHNAWRVVTLIGQCVRNRQKAKCPFIKCLLALTHLAVGEYSLDKLLLQTLLNEGRSCSQ